MGKKMRDSFPRGAINLETEEFTVIKKVVKKGGLKWFSYVKRNYGNRFTKDAEHYYPFDRVLDKDTNKYMSIRDALIRIENEISLKTLDCLDDDEKKTYAALYERSFVSSKFLKVQYKGIFRNSGRFRRMVRWSAMDELAMSFVNEEAKRLWEKEGYPIGILDKGLVNIPNLKWFRESAEKETLTEEEFDRISEVFKKCINIQ